LKRKTRSPLRNAVAVSVSATGSNCLKPQPAEIIESPIRQRFSIRNRIELFEAARLAIHSKGI
jgi:hypothetical protein